MLNLGLLILRLVLGGIFLGHGSQKLFGWFGGGGIKGTTAFMRQMGARPAALWAWIATASEFGGGLLVLLGFLTPLGSLGIAAAMMVAIIQVLWEKGFWNLKGGYEYALLNLTAALALGMTGPGAYSLDGVLHTALPEPWALGIGLLLVLAGLAIEQLTRASAPPAEAGR